MVTINRIGQTQSATPPSKSQALGRGLAQAPRTATGKGLQTLFATPRKLTREEAWLDRVRQANRLPLHPHHIQEFGIRYAFVCFQRDAMVECGGPAIAQWAGAVAASPIIRQEAV